MYIFVIFCSAVKCRYPSMDVKSATPWHTVGYVTTSAVAMCLCACVRLHACVCACVMYTTLVIGVNYVLVTC